MMPFTQDKLYVFYLGSHPSLCATEVWQMLQSQAYEPKVVAADTRYLIVATTKILSPTVMKRLGGSDRIGVVRSITDKQPTAVDLSEFMHPANKTGKQIVGISSIGLPTGYGPATARQLKKAIKAQGGRLQFILPGQGTRLNAAQVIFNHLTIAPHQELTIIKHEQHFYLVETLYVQDIQGYEIRDTGRPARDAKIGMLPPKLAQILLNLATAHTRTPDAQKICDPFCGLGTILQEGWLMSHQLTGFDISSRMIDATTLNLAWLADRFAVDQALRPNVATHDVTLPFTESFWDTFDAVITEPYLGRPQSRPLSPTEATKQLAAVETLYRQATKNIHAILRQHGIVLLILPLLRTTGSRGTTFTSCPPTLLDDIAALGYRMIDLTPEAIRSVFPGSARGTHRYARPDALVGRELTLWQKT